MTNQKPAFYLGVEEASDPEDLGSAVIAPAFELPVIIIIIIIIITCPSRSSSSVNQKPRVVDSQEIFFQLAGTLASYNGHELDLINCESSYICELNWHHTNDS